LAPGAGTRGASGRITVDFLQGASMHDLNTCVTEGQQAKVTSRPKIDRQKLVGAARIPMGFYHNSQ
jgi:hypothetical protein